MELTEKAKILNEVLVKGDLAKLTDEQKVSHLQAVCDSIGLNPLTNPLAYISMNGKLVLYAKKDATDQLRKIHNVTVKITSRETQNDCFIVTAAADLAGRSDESIGAVYLGNNKGDALANLFMKAETKAKRRVTLSICGLGFLDETEVESIPEVRTETKKEIPAGELKKIQDLTIDLSLKNGWADEDFEKVVKSKWNKKFEELDIEQLRELYKFLNKKLPFEA